MSWFEHHHWWRGKVGISAITTSQTSQTAGGAYYIEHCSCGAVRQIEIRIGQAPVVYVTEPGLTNQQKS